MPIDKELLIDQLRSVSADFKGTVIAAEIADNGIPHHHIFFRNLSSFKRFISKDVATVAWSANDNDPDLLVFELNRDGIYDMMPEGITHSSSRTKSEVVEEFALHRREEQNARAFFSTFENEFLHHTLQLEVVEREIYNNKNVEQTRYLFEQIYGDSGLLNDIQVLTLMYILPVSSKLRGNVRLISETLSKILNYKIVVTREYGKIGLPEEAFPAARSGSCLLDIDSVLSDDGIYCFHYTITVHDVGNEDFQYFYENMKHRNVIDYVSRFLFPADAAIEVCLLPAEDEKDFGISLDERVNYLSFNSCI